MPVKVHGLLAEFESSDALVAAAERAHTEGFTRVDAFSPYPLPEAVYALGYRSPGIAWMVFVGGLVGCCAAFFMQYWIEAVNYPINVGGKPPNSWPMFIPITFELTVLAAGLTAFLGVFVLCRLPRYHHPLFATPLFGRATRDGFYLCIESSDPKFDAVATRDFLASLHPSGIEEVADEPV